MGVFYTCIYLYVCGHVHLFLVLCSIPVVHDTVFIMRGGQVIRSRLRNGAVARAALSFVMFFPLVFSFVLR